MDCLKIAVTYIELVAWVYIAGNEFRCNWYGTMNAFPGLSVTPMILTVIKFVDGLYGPVCSFLMWLWSTLVTSTN